MLVRRTILPAVVAAALVLAPAAAATAQPPGGFEPPSDGAGAGGGPDGIRPAGYPVAVLDLPSAGLLYTPIEIVLDASTGQDIVAQELRIYEPDGTLAFWLRAYEPPSPDVWVNYLADTTGTHTVTLTVTTAAGYADSTEHDYLVWRLPDLVGLPQL